MSSFEWTCPYCGIHRETKQRTPPPHCVNCGLAMNRVWSTFAVNRVTSIQPHYNHAVGAYVRNSGELKSEFSRNSDEMSERMGFHVQYEPVDPVDLKNSPEDFGVTQEGLDVQQKAWREQGGPPQ